MNQPQLFINGDEFIPSTPQIPGGVMTGIGGMPETDEPVLDCGIGTIEEYDMPGNALLMWVLTEIWNSTL